MNTQDNTHCIKWDRKKALDFLTLYNETKDIGGGIINFEGIEIGVKYARYLIQWFLQKKLLKPGDFK